MTTMEQALELGSDALQAWREFVYHYNLGWDSKKCHYFSPVFDTKTFKLTAIVIYWNRYVSDKDRMRVNTLIEEYGESLGSVYDSITIYVIYRSRNKSHKAFEG